MPCSRAWAHMGPVDITDEIIEMLYNRCLPADGNPVARFGHTLVLEYNLHVAGFKGQVEGFAEIVIRAIRLKQPSLNDARGQHIVRVLGVAVNREETLK